jgi:hypothetical protein
MTAPFALMQGAGTPQHTTQLTIFSCRRSVASPKKREAIMEGLVQSIDGLAIQYWMLWATVIVAGFVTWNIWMGKHHQ